MIRFAKWGRTFASCLVLLSISGCGTMPGGKPDQLLVKSIENVIGKANFSFSGSSQTNVSGTVMPQSASFEGAVVNHDKLYMKMLPDQTGAVPRDSSGKLSANAQGVLYTRSNDEWVTATPTASPADILGRLNPLMKLEQLQTLHKQVTLDAKESNAKTRVLVAKADSGDIKQLVESQLRTEQQQLSARKLAEITRGSKLSAAQQQRLNADLQAVLQKANAELEQLIGTLAVDADYTLWVDAATNLPQHMVMQTRMRYQLQGKPIDETNVTSYTFKDYDKQTVIPQP